MEPIVLAALIAAIPATLAATSSIRNGRQLKTGNGVTVGQTMAALYQHISDDCIHVDCNEETHEQHMIVPASLTT